jgi:hypothetical protein
LEGSRFSGGNWPLTKNRLGGQVENWPVGQVNQPLCLLFNLDRYVAYVKLKVERFLSVQEKIKYDSGKLHSEYNHQDLQFRRSRVFLVGVRLLNG